MFGEKCPKCDKRISKKHSFCSNCGKNLNSTEEDKDYGFLGKNDLNNMDIKLPFGVKAMLKPLMKEFNKQMLELDKEMRKEEKDVDKDSNRRKVKSFSVHIGMPGQKPIKFNSNPTGSIQIASKENIDIGLPKINSKKLEKTKDLPREEPNTSIRRLSDSVVYEVEFPEVNSIADINIAKLEDGLEVKAISKKKIFVKEIDVTLPLKKYNFEDQVLILEFGLK